MPSNRYLSHLERIDLIAGLDADVVKLGRDFPPRATTGFHSFAQRLSFDGLATDSPISCEHWL